MENWSRSSPMFIIKIPKQWFDGEKLSAEDGGRSSKENKNEDKFTELKGAEIVNQKLYLDTRQN